MVWIKIHYRWWSEVTLCSGILAMSVVPDTLDVKRANVRTFIYFMLDQRILLDHRRVPGDVFFQFIEHVLAMTNPDRQALRNKWTACIQVLLLKDLLEYEPLLSLRIHTIRKMALNSAASDPPCKAKPVLGTDILDKLPRSERVVAILWLTTGLRFASLAAKNLHRLIARTPPYAHERLKIRTKNNQWSLPFVVCCCMVSYESSCPLCNPLKLPIEQVEEKVLSIMRTLKCTFHSARRTLAIAIKIHLKALRDPKLAAIAIRTIAQAFGWGVNKKGQCASFNRYTVDAEDFIDQRFPREVMNLVRFLDDFIPVFHGMPETDAQFSVFLSWVNKRNQS